MNSFRTNLENIPFGITENGANMYESTDNKCLDLFALGAATRNRSDEDRLALFKEAYAENPDMAFQILWYIGDVRNGQGERDFFRICYKWMCEEHPMTAKKYLDEIPNYKRWDDLVYIGMDLMPNTVGTIVANQLDKDIHNYLENKSVSLCAKWLPSINASSNKTRAMAKRLCKALGIDYKRYRKMLAKLRGYLNIVEKNLTNRNYKNIDYSQVPSQANIKYHQAFMRNDEDRYSDFIENKESKMNMTVTYPYQIVHQIVYNNLDRDVAQKMWDNLPDYLNGDKSNTICVVDTSGSMEGTPLDVACSLGLYFGERNRGPFKDCYISFSSRPKLVEFANGDIKDKVRKIYGDNLCENTNIKKVFDLLLEIAKKPATKREDIPENILIISDMEFDYAQEGNFESAFDKIKREWKAAGFEMPKLIFWNVDARQNNLPIISGSVSFVSGFSPVIFKTIITGKQGEELMQEAIAQYSKFITLD